MYEFHKVHVRIFAHFHKQNSFDSNGTHEIFHFRIILQYVLHSIFDYLKLQSHLAAIL